MASKGIPFLLLVDITEGSAPDNRRISDEWPSSHPQLISVSAAYQKNQCKAMISY